MVDIFTESTLTINEACHLLPRGRKGSKPHFATVYRWIVDGVKSADGTVVKLEAARIGAKWVTSKEALTRFVDRLGRSSSANTDETPTRRPSIRQKASERAEKRLTAKGV